MSIHSEKSENSESSTPKEEMDSDEQQRLITSLTGKRGGHRARITVLLNDIELLMKDTEPDWTQFTQKVSDVEKQRHRVNYYTSEILKYMIDDESKSTEVKETEEKDNLLVERIRELRAFIESLPKQKQIDKSKGAISKVYYSDKNLSSNEHQLNQSENILVRKRDSYIKLTHKTISDIKNLLESKNVKIMELKALKTELIHCQNIISKLVEEIYSELPEVGFTALEENLLFQREINLHLETVENYIEREKALGKSNQPKINTGGTNFRLERISIPSFDGNITEYLTWKQSFYAGVENQDMSIAERHQYLRNSLKGNALKLIAGLPQTNDYYKEALDLLESNYNDKTKIVQNHLDILFELKKPEYKYQALLDFNANFENNVRALQSHEIGIHPEDSGVIIGYEISKLLPKEVKDEVKEQKKGKPWDLELIRLALKKSIVYLRADADENNKKEISKKTSTDKRQNNPSASKPKNYLQQNYQSRETTMATTVQDQISRPCVFCNQQGHFDGKCNVYSTNQARKDRVKELRLCYMCLKKGHTVQECKGNYKACFHCRDWNHRGPMCPKNPNLSSKEETKVQNQSNNQVGFSSTSNNLLVRNSSLPSVALPLAVLTIKQDNIKHRIKALFDTGSQRSLINQSVVNRLQLRTHKSVKLQINGINSQGKVKSYDIISFSVLNKGKPIQVEALVVNKLPNDLNIPNLAEITKVLKQKGIWLANPNQRTSQVNDIDIIIGADFYNKFGLRPYQFDNIQLLDSKVNTMIYGVLPTLPQSNQVSINTASIFRVDIEPPMDIYNDTNSNSELDLQKLWSLSHIGIDPKDLTVVEKNVLSEFKTELSFEDGHYVVKLPWKTSEPVLPDNYSTAKKIMYSSLNKLRKDPEKLELYNNVFKEQIKLGFIEEVKPNETLHPNARVHYMPHLGIFKESATSPLRIVFNSSSGKPSLNDNLWQGPCLLQNLCSLFLRFRLKQWATVSDLAKAFHQVHLHPSDRDSTRFLWVDDPSNPYSRIKTFRFKVVVFGINASPFLLNACLQHHLANSESPLATTIAENLYVDNLLGNFDTKEEVSNYYNTANELMSEGGFYLREWNSNEPEIKQQIEQDQRGTETETEKVLGMIWDTSKDTILYNIKNLDINADTKRAVLRNVASIFDVLGYLNPILIKGKILLQKLWKADLQWDDSISFYQPELKTEWEGICKSLQKAITLKVPRQLVFDNEIELHAFSDASGSAYGTAIYVISAGESRLLISKARVAPIKELSIPKMELTAALLSARLITFVLETLSNKVKVKNIICWSDSQVTLSWINSKKQLPAYMQNRVEEIRKLIPEVKWKYVPTSDNPSDYISRGVTNNKLRSDLWLQGPVWLATEEDWPICTNESCESTVEREPSQNIEIVEFNERDLIAAINVTPVSEVTKIEDLFDITAFSSLKKVYSITRLVFRFIGNLRSKGKERQKSTKVGGKLFHNFSATEITAAENYWLQQIQIQAFGKEMLVEGKSFPSSSKYNQFNVFYHKDSNLLRCNRRLGNASLPFETAYPILLPHDHYYVTLLIRSLHQEHSHINVPHLITLLRSKFFFIRMRQKARSIVRGCILCKRLQAVHYPSPPSSMLPAGRVNECAPFQVIGVDYTGFFKVKEGSNIIKVYIALFSCAVTRAIHLELVEDNSVDVFLQAFRRFVARRGLPSQVYSDNGSYFVSASDYLKRLHELPSVKEYLNEHRISWRFNPARASHFGGQFERLIGVVKSCLKKTLTTNLVTRNEFETILVETEGIVNSRPLTYVSDNFDDDTPLTPQNLLTGYQTKRLPIPQEFIEQDEDYQQKNIKARYKKLLKLIDRFWLRWKNEYLLHLKQSNTRQGQLQIKKGDVVLIEDDGPRLKWKLGLVVQLHTAQDGFTRSVAVKTRNGVITRATIHLYPLEINCNLECPSSSEDTEPIAVREKRAAHILARDRIAKMFEN